MESQVLEKIMSGQAILFNGAGFSFGAKNIDGTAIPSGKKLSEYLAKKCKIDINSDLKIASKCYIKQFSKEELIQELKSILTVSEVTEYHKSIANLPWKRIYTTNYDCVIEHAANSIGKCLNTIRLSDSIRDNAKDNICIHLNGVITHLNKATLDNEFKLTDSSYITEDLTSNPWFSLMRSDFETADLIVVIGYSMQSDIDILRLFANPTIKEKIIIIDSNNPSEENKLMLPDYGEYMPIGLNNFSIEIDNFKTTYIPSLLSKQFYSFSYSQQNPQTSTEASFTDIFELYSIGKYSPLLLECKYNGEYRDGYKYLLLRKSVETILTNLNKYRYFVVTSDLGNGKTIFCKILQNEFQYTKYPVFEFKKRQSDWKNEVKEICNEYKQGMIIIDDYPSAMDILYEFAYYDISKLKFVLTARTAINKTKYRNLIEKLNINPNSIKLIDINLLNSSEVDNLAQILKSQRVLGKLPVQDNYDAITKFISNDCKSKFCDLLLELYNSSDIKQRLTKLFSEISNESDDFKSVLIFALMKPVMGLKIDLIDFENLLEINHAHFSTSENSIINELFDFKGNEPIVKSSIVAKNILYNIISIDNVLEISKKMLVACKKQNSYSDLQINLMSHTHYTIFKLNEDNLHKILKFYDSLRNYYSDNHFFWEQYALICINLKDYRTANACIETAYQIAKNNNSFVPFQIDTIYGNCLLSELIDRNEDFAHNEAIERTYEACNRILRNIDHVDNDKYRAFKQLSRISQIYTLFKEKFDNRDISIFKEISHKVITEFANHKKSGECSFAKELDKWISDIKGCK